MTTGHRPITPAITAAAAGAPPGDRGVRLQPPLHRLVVAVAAPTSVLSARSGDVDAREADAGAQGLYHADVRVLSVARLTLGGAAPTPVLGADDGPGAARFVGLARRLGDAGAADATVRVDRRRRVEPGRLVEEVTISSTAAAPLRADLVLELAVDFEQVDQVKGGFRTSRPAAVPLFTTSPPDAPADGTADGAADGAPGGAAAGVGSWTAAAPAPPTGRPPVSVVVTSAGAVAGPRGLTWALDVAPRSSVTVRWTATAIERDVAFVAARAGVVTAASGALSVRAGDDRLGWLVRQGLDDVRGLLMAHRQHPGDVFVAAGAPWFLTLFGRDSLWTARMLLPLGTELAAGTLRALAARQGRRDDPRTQEEPGKILHEVREHAFEHAQGHRLPPVYYGSVDATLLWVCLLHDAWRWGLPPEQVQPLLPAMEAAMGWAERAAATGAGFIAYHDPTGRGLANQGWKDSGDAVRFVDGRLAQAPVALAEVQGYAHEAALGAAELLDAFGRPGAGHWRAWAAALATRFAEHYWVADEQGPYPAMALDGEGRPVDAVASNMGHLLGTGLLDAAGTGHVAARLASEAMAGAYGLRTMSALMGGYSPTSYHCGSVWPHDTAIAVHGLVRSGHGGAAHELVAGFLGAAVRFEGRLPELWGGDGRHEMPAPVAYPGACRPQAWSAAAPLAVTAALLGLEADVPGGVLRVRPVAPSPVVGLAVEGLRLAGHALEIEVDPSGRVVRAATDAPVRIETG